MNRYTTHVLTGHCPQAPLRQVGILYSDPGGGCASLDEYRWFLLTPQPPFPLPETTRAELGLSGPPMALVCVWWGESQTFSQPTFKIKSL